MLKYYNMREGRDIYQAYDVSIMLPSNNQV